MHMEQKEYLEEVQSNIMKQCNALQKLTQQNIKIATETPLKATAMMLDNYAIFLNSMSHYQSSNEQTLEQQAHLISALTIKTDDLLNEQQTLNKKIKQQADKSQTQTQTIKKHNATIKKLQLDDEAQKNQHQLELQQATDLHQSNVDALNTNFNDQLADRDAQLNEKTKQHQTTIDQLTKKLMESTLKLEKALNQKTNEPQH